MLFHYTDQQLGNYYLQHPLGQGNFSEVYLAEHIHTHEQVAIKLLSGRRSEQDADHFLAQADALTHLRHPHIVSVLDFGIEDGIAFLVMNYTPHGTLRQRHPKGTRVPLDTVINYVKQIGDALHYVHEHKIVHRDIKPHNMLLGPEKQIWLSDFGIAMLSKSIDSSREGSCDFEGTVVYAAPEQLQGLPQRSSDQYSLGVVTYEWLTGEWLFHGTFAEISSKHLFEPPPPLRRRDLDIPPEVEKVVLKALSKDPGCRFHTVQEFAEELEWASAEGRTMLVQVPPRRQFKSPQPFVVKAG